MVDTDAATVLATSTGRVAQMVRTQTILHFRADLSHKYQLSSTQKSVRHRELPSVGAPTDSGVLVIRDVDCQMHLCTNGIGAPTPVLY